MKVQYRRTWRNTTGKHYCQPLKYFELRTLADLRQIVREAEREGVRVRAVGSGHSFSDVAISSGYLVSFARLNQLLGLPER